MTAHCIRFFPAVWHNWQHLSRFSKSLNVMMEFQQESEFDKISMEPEVFGRSKNYRPLDQQKRMPTHGLEIFRNESKCLGFIAVVFKNKLKFRNKPAVFWPFPLRYMYPPQRCMQQNLTMITCTIWGQQIYIYIRSWVVVMRKLRGRPVCSVNFSRWNKKTAPHWGIV